MPRLFTGLSVPPEVANRLTLLQFGLPRARWIEATDFHITLRFFGDVTGDQADDLAASLDQLSHPIFRVQLQGLGAFGGAKPRLVWAGVLSSPALAALQQAHEVLAQRLGHPAEGRKFTPHVTLARLRGGTAQDVSTYLSMNEGGPIAEFEVREVLLYSAKASTGGGPYLVEARYPLG